jgi:hypothetical protein
VPLFPQSYAGVRRVRPETADLLFHVYRREVYTRFIVAA